ncbi:MAG: methyltransferase domain-containing protein [Caldilinea sp. CFX5]|nr:methyltransferase domain-containing protein [Caldilinea sp. CFX5]
MTTDVDETKLDHWLQIQKMLRGYRVGQVLITCTRLGVFQALANGPATASTLAVQTGSDAAALARLLNAAVALDLLTKENDHYANAPLAATCLAQDAPYYMGHMVRREHAFYQRWSWLDAAVRTGQRPDANIRDEGQTNWVLDFELALYDLARVNAPAVATALTLPTDRPLRVLDVGGGHGGYSMALAQRYPNVQPTVFELPAAAEAARSIIDRAGMADRVAVQTGNFQTDDLGAGYDLILLFGVLVSETPAGKLALLRKAHQALVPSGQLAIREWCFAEERTGPPEVTIASLHMLLSTQAGDIATLSEMQGWLAQAGFVPPTRLNLPTWAGSVLVTHKL